MNLTFRNAERKDTLLILQFIKELADYEKMLNEDKDGWDEMIQYAKSLGVPDEQLDFLPEDFTQRR